MSPGVLDQPVESFPAETGLPDSVGAGLVVRSDLERPVRGIAYHAALMYFNEVYHGDLNEVVISMKLVTAAAMDRRLALIVPPHREMFWREVALGRLTVLDRWHTAIEGCVQMGGNGFLTPPIYDVDKIAACLLNDTAYSDSATAHLFGTASVTAHLVEIVFNRWDGPRTPYFLFKDFEGVAPLDKGTSRPLRDNQ